MTLQAGRLLLSGRTYFNSKGVFWPLTTGRPHLALCSGSSSWRLRVQQEHGEHRRAGHCKATCRPSSPPKRFHVHTASCPGKFTVCSSQSCQRVAVKGFQQFGSEERNRYTEQLTLWLHHEASPRRSCSHTGHLPGDTGLSHEENGQPGNHQISTGSQGSWTQDLLGQVQENGNNSESAKDILPLCNLVFWARIDPFSCQLPLLRY